MREEAGDLYKALIIPVREVSPGIAVVMNIDQAGKDNGTFQIYPAFGSSLGDLGKAAVFHREGTVEKAGTLRKYFCILKKHKDTPPEQIY